MNKNDFKYTFNTNIVQITLRSRIIVEEKTVKEIK